MISQNELKEVRERYKNIGIKWVRSSGLYAEYLKIRDVKLVMPLSDQHTNHVGIAYAGSIFVITEMAAAALFFCTYGLKRFVPIVRGVNINYLRPTQKDLIAELSLQKNDSIKMINDIEQLGKGDMEFDVIVKDIDNREVAKSKVIFHVIPFTKKFIKNNKTDE